MQGNGYDAAKVWDALKDRIGFEQSYVTGYSILNTENRTSNSGKFFGTDPLVTIKNIKDVQESPDISDSNFNTWLRSFNKKVSLDIIGKVLASNKSVDSGLLFVPNSTLVKRIIPNSGKFCGWRIRVAVGEYAIELINASLLFDRDVDITIYCFNNLKKEPIFFKEVSAVGNDLTIVNINEVLRNIDTSIQGGSYYIGYFQEELGAAQAIHLEGQRQCYNLLNTMSFESTAIGDDFDRENISANYNHYGIGFEIVSYRDYTKSITRQPFLFDDLRILGMDAAVIELIVKTLRINATDSMLSANAALANLYAELNRDEPSPVNGYNTGLKRKLQNEILAVRKMFFNKPQISISCST